MRWNWLRDRETQNQLRVYWDKGENNDADYYTKHFAPLYHRSQRPRVILKNHHVSKCPSYVPNALSQFKQNPQLKNCSVHNYGTHLASCLPHRQQPFLSTTPPTTDACTAPGTKPTMPFKSPCPVTLQNHSPTSNTPQTLSPNAYRLPAPWHLSRTTHAPLIPLCSQSSMTSLPNNSKHPLPSTRRLTSHEPSTRRTASHVRGCVDTPTVNQALTHVASTVNQTLSPLYPEVHSMDDMFQQSLTH